MIPSNGKTHVETTSTLTDPNASEPMQPDAQPSVLSLREMAKRTAQGIVLIGQWLSEAKQQLPHGDWLPWLKESLVGQIRVHGTSYMSMNASNSKTF
jgi:hypothetical protein